MGLYRPRIQRLARGAESISSSAFISGHGEATELKYRCLQEITYLTSPGALNPLPTRAPITIERPASPAVSANDKENGNGAAGASPQAAGEKAATAELPERPRKALPTRSIPAPTPEKEGEEGHDEAGAVANKVEEASPAPVPTAPTRILKREEPKANGSPLKKQSKPLDPPASATGSTVDTLKKDARTQQPPSSPARRSMPLPVDEVSQESDLQVHEKEDTAGAQGEEPSTIHATGADITADEPKDVGPLAPIATDDAAEQEDQAQLLTAIYRPESKAAWRDQLRHATEQAEKARDRSSSISSNSDASTVVAEEEQLHAISLNSAESEEGAKGDSAQVQANDDKAWTSRKVLKSHLDIVRSVAFAGTSSGAGAHTAAGAAGAAWGKTGGYAGNVVLVSGGDDCTVKVWSVAAGALRSPR